MYKRDASPGVYKGMLVLVACISLALLTGCPGVDLSNLVAGGAAGAIGAGDADGAGGVDVDDVDDTDGTDDGDDGDDDDADVTLTGTVTNSLSGATISGATVTVDPEVEGVEITTGEDGTYSAVLPTGVYDLTFEVDNYDSNTRTVSITEGASTTQDITLTPTEAVVVSATISGDAEPGGTVTATATVEILDGSTTVRSYAWTQSNSVTATISRATSAEATVTLPGVAAYKVELLTLLTEPPISADGLPDHVPAPETEDGEFFAGLQDRFHVVGLNPFTLEETGLIEVEVTVVTSSGTFTADAEIHTELPWKPAPGLHNVPIGRAVLLHGKTQATYDWALDGPTGSRAALTDATTQNPYFTPDVTGLYTVTVTDLTASPAAEVTLEIYAGTWSGGITGQDANGLPTAEDCTLCHGGGTIGFSIAPDMFTDWSQTGHAMVFSDNVDTSTHYGEGCFSCHTVGYDPDVDNGGFDEAADFEDFLDAGLLNVPGDNWTTVLADYPETAQLANIQCENCHGPNSGGAHGTADPRISISSDVCGVCHGEPLRHARFQQWQLSHHADYELAIEEGQSGNCSRCHTGNGFLAWLPALLSGDPTANVTVTWTEDETHPQTCVVCHDPHDVGTTTGVDTDATVRIYGNTPELLAGYTVTSAGNGAICMVCHNSRRGLRNDDTFAATVADGDAARAPHGPTQTDVLMGENAYLVEAGLRGSHGLIEDTCVNCHMERTPPPDLLSHNLGGTNHTFFASEDVCAECHGEVVEASGIQNIVQSELDDLLDLIEDAFLDLIETQITAGNTIDLNGEAEITDAAEIADIDFGEYRGRQAFTVTLTDGTVVGPVRLSDVDVLDATPASLGELYDFAADGLIKAGWNWNLINNDGSLGVHNPGFVLEVLDASIDALTP